MIIVVGNGERPLSNYGREAGHTLSTVRHHASQGSSRRVQFKDQHLRAKPANPPFTRVSTSPRSYPSTRRCSLHSPTMAPCSVTSGDDEHFDQRILPRSQVRLRSWARCLWEPRRSSIRKGEERFDENGAKLRSSPTPHGSLLLGTTGSRIARRGHIDDALTRITIHHLCDPTDCNLRRPSIQLRSAAHPVSERFSLPPGRCG